MRPGSCLFVLLFGSLLDTSFAALEAVTGVTATANGWDARTTGYGCVPKGCLPANVLEPSIDDDSRWSCLPSRQGVEVCELIFDFDEPQDIFEIRVAMWKGDRRSRTIDVWVDGVLSTRAETSGVTLGYEVYYLSATQASSIVLQQAGPLEEWLSITGVQLMTQSEVEVFPPGPAPTSDEYLGCFNDMVADRVLTTVVTDKAMTLEDCAAKCGELVQLYYGLQQGNECWCAGCEITEQETNTDFDRHGDGTCNTPCAGDPTSSCGGDVAISLYQSITCLVTPAPTPSIPPSECPSGSTQASLHVTATWDTSRFSYFSLFVMEPGGAEVRDGYGPTERGDVGMWTRGGLNPSTFDSTDSERESAAYVTFNGLDVSTDAVLGDYEIWGTGREGTLWTITARSGGELLWVAGGEFSEFETETRRMIATVTSYADSDCKNDNYGKCPVDTFGSDGHPPCTKCPSGLLARHGATFCTHPALRNLGVPENIHDAIVADAVGGWAGPGSFDLNNGDPVYLMRTHSVAGEELGTITLSGNFAKDDNTALGSSTVLRLYLYNENSETDFVRGQGELDLDSGNFTATITDLPVGFSTGVLSFVTLDPADAGENNDRYDTAFSVGMVNEGCSDALRIRLEWETDAEMELWVSDPNGDRINDYNPITDNGYISVHDSDGRRLVDPETGATSSFEEYVLFSWLSGDSMLGEYRTFARGFRESIHWTLTATVAGAVLWVEEGVLGSYYDDDDTTSSRRLVTSSSFYPSSTSYSSTGYPESDTFTVNLDTYDPAGC